MNNDESGVVKYWNEEKRYGFVKPEKGGEDLFFHAQFIVPHGTILARNDKVVFERAKNKDGKWQARNVRAEQ